MYAHLRPLLWSLEPELAHNIAIQLIRFGFLNIYSSSPHADLEVSVGDLSFPSPIGMAAGFDKNAEVFDQLFKIGFGFVEVGTGTPIAQEGNPKPRIFRLEQDKSLINSLGFNNIGIDKICINIANNLNPKSIQKLGINIGPNKDSKDRINDYVESLKKVQNQSDYVTINVSSPNTPNLRNFENDELDVAFISINDVERARDVTSDLNPLYSVWPQFTISYFAFNIEKPPFDDVHIRRALGLSIDRQKVAEVTFNGMLAPATGILAPGLPGYTDVDKTLPFNPNRAREELLASKYKVENGQLVTSQGEVVPIVITEVGGGAEARIDTQAFLDQWSTELGVNVEIRQTDFATYLAESDAKQLQMFNGGWIMDYPDPENILDLKFHSQSGLNDLGYQNTAVDELLELARSELNSDQRITLYRDAEKLILEDAAWLPLYFSQNHVVVNADVNGWFEPPMVVPRLRFIEVNR